MYMRFTLDNTLDCALQYTLGCALGLYTRCVHMCSNVSRYSLVYSDVHWTVHWMYKDCTLGCTLLYPACTLRCTLGCEETSTSMMFSSTSWTHILWTYICKMPTSNDFIIVSSDFFLEVQVDTISLFSRCQKRLKVNLLTLYYNQRLIDSKLFNV